MRLPSEWKSLFVFCFEEICSRMLAFEMQDRFSFFFWKESAHVCLLSCCKVFLSRMVSLGEMDDIREALHRQIVLSRIFSGKNEVMHRCLAIARSSSVVWFFFRENQLIQSCLASPSFFFLMYSLRCVKCLLTAIFLDMIVAQVVWESLSKALHSKDMKLANKEKKRIEQAQRDKEKDRKTPWQPRFYRPTEDGAAWEPDLNAIRQIHASHMDVLPASVTVIE